MAIYNEILVGRYARMLQKLFSMKGMAPVKQLAGEITPNISVFSGVENRYLEGWETFSILIGQAAVAAQVGVVRLRNPVANNVIAVLIRVSCFTSLVADTYDLNSVTTAADLSATTTGRRLDARGRLASACMASSTTQAAPVAGVIRVNTPANTSADFIWTDVQEIPLLPGDAIDIHGNTVNTFFATSFMWRERFLEDSERT